MSLFSGVGVGEVPDTEIFQMSILSFPQTLLHRQSLTRNLLETVPTARSLGRIGSPRRALCLRAMEMPTQPSGQYRHLLTRLRRKYWKTEDSHYDPGRLVRNSEPTREFIQRKGPPRRGEKGHWGSTDKELWPETEQIRDPGFKSSSWRDILEMSCIYTD